MFNHHAVKITLLLYVSLLIPVSVSSQTGQTAKRFHTGIFLQAYSATQFFDYELASSKIRPGFALGVYEHYDLGSKFQIRVGCAYSFSTLYSKDYSPTFPGDYDPSKGEVDIYKSYVANEVKLGQIYIPLHLRYKFGEAAKHVFLAAGVEYRIVLSDSFEAKIYESGVNIIEFDNQPFYDTRSPNLATHLEIGYELPWQSHKFNFSIFSRYGLRNQIEGEGQAFYGIYQGHAFDIGLGAELVF